MVHLKRRRHNNDFNRAVGADRCSCRHPGGRYAGPLDERQLYSHAAAGAGVRMSQRSNRKAKMLEQLRRRGYNLPGSSCAKSIPVGYDGKFPKKDHTAHVAVERTEQ